MKYEALHKEIEAVFLMMNCEPKQVDVYRDPELEMLICSVSLSHQDAEIFFEERESAFRDYSHIARILLEKKHSLSTNILFDINQRQLSFIKQAKEKAQIASERVEFFGKEYEFGYLNGYERMIVHAFLKNKKGIVTESHGEGSERRLVVKPEQTK